MKHCVTALLLAALAAPAAAQPAPQPATDAPLAGLSFLVGNWAAGQGQVAETGGTAQGRSTFTLEANGHVLLRRDHTDLFDRGGKPAGGFAQVMMIWPEDGTLHADYSDGSHIIHYVAATVDAGHAVTFTSAPRPDRPTFRLSYALADPVTLTVTFAMAPPGGGAFHPIATGRLTRAE